MDDIRKAFDDLLGQQLFGEKLVYLDDLDPAQMTEEHKAVLKEMLEKEPYRFYSFWRDPDAAQRRYEGDNFKTTPATELYTRIGALRAAGAPGSVVEYWKQLLETAGRPNDVFAKLKKPKDKPVPEKLAKVEEFCAYLEDYFNLEDQGPAISDLNNPYADHWDDVMNAALGIPEDDEPLHGVDVRHYKDPFNGGATSCEVVEAHFHLKHATIDLLELSNMIKANYFDITRTDDSFVVKFWCADCYTE